MRKPKGDARSSEIPKTGKGLKQQAFKHPPAPARAGAEAPGFTCTTSHAQVGHNKFKNNELSKI